MRLTILSLLCAVTVYGQGSQTPIYNGLLQSDLNAAGFKILSANLADYAGTNMTWNAVTGKFDATGGGGGTGTPGGVTTQVQYNNAGAFSGISTMTTNGTVVTQKTGTNFVLADPTTATKKAIFDLSNLPVATSTFTFLDPGVILTDTDIGSAVQAWDADLNVWATKTPYAGTVVVTTGKTFTSSNTLTLAGTDGSTLNIGTGGTLGTAAYTASTAYQPADADLTTWAGITPTTVGQSFVTLANPGAITFPEISATNVVSAKTAAQLKTDLSLTATDVGLGNVTNNAQTQAAIVPNTAPSSGQILIGNVGNTAYAKNSLSGSGATMSLGPTGVLTISAIPESSLSITNVTTGDATTSAHGFAPKGTTGTTQFWRQDWTLATPGGTGTVTATGGALTANSVVLGAGTTDTKVVGGIITDGTSKITLGVSTTSVGTIDFKNLTSGTATITPPTGALGTDTITLPNASSTLPIFGQQITFAGPTAARTITLPDANFTVARTDAANTFTGASTGTSWTMTTPVIAGGLTASGSGANTFAGSSGTFVTSTGANTLSANTTISGTTTITPAARSSGVASYFTLNIPTDTAQTAATEAIGLKTVTGTRTWATTGTVGLQRENYLAGPTYASASASQTFTDPFTLYIDKPIQGTNAIFTRPHSLGIVDSTSAASSITGGLVVATTLGTAATSVGVGGGNLNAGGTITSGSTINAVTGYQLGGAEFPTAANGIVKRTAANTYSAAVAKTDYWDTTDFVGDSGGAGVHGLVPTPGNVAGTTKFLREDATWAVPAGGAGAPGGSNTQVQFNDSSAFAGDSAMTWDKTNHVLTIGGSTSTSTFRVNTLETQGYGLNNAWIGENAYFDGAGFKYRATGKAGLFYFFGDEGQFRFFVSGTGGTAIPGNASLKINSVGNFAVGTTLSATNADFTGSALMLNTATLNLRLQSGMSYVWTSGTDASGTVDTGLSRNAAGVVEVNNGTVGTYKTLKDDVTNSVTGFQVNGAAPTNYELTGNGTNFVSKASDIPNGSSAQQTGFSSNTYLSGSVITISAGDFKVGSTYRCMFDMTKTTAGTAAPVITIYIGTAGSTADTAAQTITFAAATGVADTGMFEIWVNFRAVGASATIASVGKCAHNLAATGLTSTGAAGVGVVSNSTSSTFNSTTFTKIGVAFNGGTSYVGTNNICQAYYSNP